MKKITVLILISLFCTAAGAQSFPQVIKKTAGGADFVLSSGCVAKAIFVDEKDSKTVHNAARMFSEDIERVTDNLPALRYSEKDLPEEMVIIGTIANNRLIRRLVREGKIEVTEVEGKWESCLVQVVDRPFPGVKKALVIAGSDRRGATYGAMELSRQMGVSPWYYFADVPVHKADLVAVKAGGRYIQYSPSVKYRGIFLNDEVWSLRPWAMYKHAPEEGKGLGPATYEKIFELLIRLKANTLWPAMMHQNKPFNYYPENKVLADRYGIVMGSAHNEPMLRNSIEGAEWDREYPGEPWNYATNGKHIYEFWEKRAKENGMYENIYTLGKRDQDDGKGKDATIPLLEKVIRDQREIISRHVNKDVTKVPQTVVAYTEILDMYNAGMKIPDDVIFCWPDNNFGYMRQLPDAEEQKRAGGSGLYYHYHWTNCATSSHSWVHTSPVAQTWFEMKKAYDFNVRKLWILHAADIKFFELGLDHFLGMAWDMEPYGEVESSQKFLKRWSSEYFGENFSEDIVRILNKHFELGYARRPEHMVAYKGSTDEYIWDWFSLDNYYEAQRRIDDYESLIKEVDKVYEALPFELKDVFFQMVVYNVKGAALHNLRVLNAQKSNAYGQQKRSSAATYAAKAQLAENELNALHHHYNREQVRVKDKWDHMAALAGPWYINQWKQWEMPPLSNYTGTGFPELRQAPEGPDSTALPPFSVFNRDVRYIDLYSPGNGAVYWEADCSADWIQLSAGSGVIYDEDRIWVSIDWDKVPAGKDIAGEIAFKWFTCVRDDYIYWPELSDTDKKKFMEGKPLDFKGSDGVCRTGVKVFNPVLDQAPVQPAYVESNGYISIEAEDFTATRAGKNASWKLVEGLGRTGNSVTCVPFNILPVTDPDEIVKNAPVLEYNIYTFTTGKLPVDFNCIGSNPINRDYGQRLAIAVDDHEPVIVSARGRSDYMCNLLKISGELDIPTPGFHRLKVYMVDPGVVIDKIIIQGTSTGKIQPSYLGPAPSRLYTGK